MEKVASINSGKNQGNSQPALLKQHGAPQKLLSDTEKLQLHQLLQTTLNLSNLFNKYLGWLSSVQPVGNIEYVHPDENIQLSSGPTKRHKVSYVLRLEQRYLGELTITNQKRFSEQNLQAQEQSLGILVHYLKNSIDHNRLEKIAFNDSLTGVMNRTSLDELLPREIHRAQRYESELSIIMIDIDHFKQVNDKLGHKGGDEILRLVSKAIKNQTRRSDLPFRYGGDEFLVILPNTNLTGATQAAKQVMDSLARLGETADQLPTLSIGVASYQAGESHTALVERADQAMYQAKKSGRNCVI